MSRLVLKITLAVLIGFSANVLAEAPDPDPARFAEAIETFEVWDTKNSFPENGILFVGSSSIRFWPTASAFPGKPIINRGFGGSEISDVIHYHARVVTPYAPSTIFLYVGDNDIAGGKSAAQVFDDYKEFIALVEAELPDTKVFFISIKPSVLRWDYWPTMQEANALVREYAARHPNLGFVDLASPLLGENGKPKDVFIDDGLHLNEYGYQLWQEALGPYLEQEEILAEY
jgi:lysophospholipase L1-like esterase